MNPNRNRPGNAPIRPLASILHKEGMVIIGVHKNGSEAQLVVYMDEGGNYVVPGYENLVGWKYLP